MSTPAKKRPAKLLHACKHKAVIVRENPGGSSTFIAGKFLGENEILPLGDSLHSLEYDDSGQLHIETLVEGQKPSAGSGPPKVTSAAFRQGHNAIFGPSKRERELMN